MTGVFRILHLGLGRFHRAHQAVYMQRLSMLGDTSWGISAFSMRSKDARDHMLAAQLRYPVVETEKTPEASANPSVKDSEEKANSNEVPGYNVVWVDVIREVGFAIDDRDLMLARIRDAGVKIITLTITEKGYCLGLDGDLNLSDQSIQDDLSSPLHPNTAIGALALLIRERALSGRKPLTIVSCDNLRENGRKLERAIRTYLTKVDGEGWDEALDFMVSDVSFPCSMVDRIVPELTPEAKATIESACGISHPELLATEEFTQWVIEDRFAGGRPSWDRVFVDFVRDIKPYEEMKLRMLNATHSFLAYYGTLRGYTFVHEAIADPKILDLAKTLLLTEVAPLLEKYHRRDKLIEYADRLLARFANDKLPHKLLQIAADGSEKIPQRILPSINEAIAGGTPHDALDLTVKSWTEFMHQRIGAGQVVQDPRSAKFATLYTEDLNAFTAKVLSALNS